MTLEEANMRLEQALMTLAKNSVHNQRIMAYVDQLEYFIASLKEKAAETENNE